MQTNGVVSRIQGEGEAPIDPIRLMDSRNSSESKKVAFGVHSYAASEVANLAPGEMPIPPKVLLSLDSVILQDATHLKVTFSHNVESTSAQNIANYTIADAPSIVSATLSDANSVVLYLFWRD